MYDFNDTDLALEFTESTRTFEQKSARRVCSTNGYGNNKNDRGEELIDKLIDFTTAYFEQKDFVFCLGPPEESHATMSVQNFQPCLVKGGDLNFVEHEDVQFVKPAMYVHMRRRKKRVSNGFVKRTGNGGVSSDESSKILVILVFWIELVGQTVDLSRI